MEARAASLVLDAPAGPSRPSSTPPGSGRGLVALYTLTSFVGAGLLFMVQPMVTKLVLPAYGGSPSVWNSAMVFFQASLLLGYLYAHVSIRRLGVRRQPLVHLAVLGAPLLTLPITLPGWAPPGESSPTLRILLVLIVVVGAPFAAVATTAPLLQRWFAATGHPRAHDPYFLYAASNAGSFLALLAYPLAIEPVLGLEAQTSVWAGGYVVLCLLVGACALAARRSAGPDLHDAASVTVPEPIDRRRALRWVGLAFIPSSLMLGVTTHITTDIAPVPLFWVVPLALYLATFVVAFGRTGDRRPVAAERLAVGFAFATLCAGTTGAGLAPRTVVHLGLFTAVAFVAHRRLALDRPPASQLTAFYLLLAVGGVLGGLANAMVAPVVFNRVLEYPLVIAVALVLCRRVSMAPGRGRRWRPVVEIAVIAAALLAIPDATAGRSGLLWLLFVAGVVVMGAAAHARAVPLGIAVALVLVITPLQSHGYADEERTFFGVYRVIDGDEAVALYHGSTLHGQQYKDVERRDEPLTYYHRGSGIGHVFASYRGNRAFDEVGVVGLGAGTLATYGHAGQTFTFVEIDPHVVHLATDSGLYTYLQDTAADVEIVVGDGRLEMVEQPAGRFDLLVLDAFSSDSIPVHLITREAVEIYRDRLSPQGVLAFHISNRHLDLRPVLTGIARDLDLTARVCDEPGPEPSTSASRWVVMARTADDLAPLGDDCWADLSRLEPLTWTDSFSNLLSVLHWG